MEENTQQYPTFFKAGTKANWTALNNQANTLLGFPEDGLAENYSNPIIDNNNKYWFVVNPEVSSLVDLTECVPYENIILKETI